MKQTLPIWLLLLLAVAATPCFAKKKAVVHAPLPPKVLAAKTVYIENHGSAYIADNAYDELTKWGRFEVVDSPEKADLVLLFSIASGESGTTGRTGTTSTYDPDMKTGDMKTGGWKHGTITIPGSPGSPNSTQLKILDAKTRQILYSDERYWGKHSATRGIIMELRQRIEEQEKQPKGK